MIIIDGNIINKIFEQSGREIKNVKCWVKTENDFNIYIFSAECCNEKELLEIYDGLNNDIALYFQTSLQKHPEIWNLYLFFFIKGQVSINTKYLIEQDKYCSRKLIFDNNAEQLEDTYIQDVITKKLFILDIEKITNNSEDTLTFQDKIRQRNSEILDLINNLTGKNNRKEMSIVIDHYLKEHNHEL